MNRNKKLISVICAIAMIFTMLSSLVVASADDAAATPNITFTTPEYSKDGKTATVTVGYENMNGISGGRLKIAMPEEVTEVTADIAGATGYSNGIFTLTFSVVPANPATSGKITTLTMNLSSTLAEAKDLTASAGTYLTDGNEDKFEKDKSTLTAATVQVPADPNAPTPKPHTNATPAPVATDEPSDAPVIDPPATATFGFTLGEVQFNEDGTATVDVGYTGLTAGLSGGRLKVAMPDVVTAVTADRAGANSYTDGVFTLTFSQVPPETAAEGKVTTLTLTVNAERPYTTQLKTANGSYITDGSDEKYTLGETEGFISSNTTIAATDNGGEEKTSYDIPMKKAVGTADVADDELDNNGNSKYWIKAEVKKADGTDAAYGTDYVAEYNGTPLTKAQYENLINGHLGADNVAGLGAESIQDVIDNMTYKVYDKGTKVTTPVVQTATGDIVNDAKETTAGGKTETVTKPTLSVTPASKKVTSGTTVKVTTALKEVKEGGKLYVTADGGSWDAVAGSGIRVITPLTVVAEATTAAAALVPDTKTEISPDATVQFVAAVAGQKVILTYTYEGKNSDGTDATLEQKVTYTVTEKTVKGGGGSSSSSDDDDDDNSGSGSIATGNQGASNGAVTGIGFTDLGDVEWARTAINALALRNVVNGRGNGIFAPNDTITRAEYCQMVINAMGKANDSATSQFSDVSTDDWFYHNVAVASQLGIVVGFGDGTFHPYEKITREQMAVMTYKAVQVMGKGLASSSVSFSDDANIADWSRDSVYALAGAGIINGMGDGTFAPQANATRAQAAVIIYNALVK